MATIAKRIFNVFEAEKFFDVVFILKTGEHCEKIKGHKMIFAAASSVFERMLFGEFPDSNEIMIEDVDKDAFKSFRKYLYTDKITFESVSNAIRVYEIADKYDVKPLLQESIKYLSSNISAENVLRIIEFARTYQKPVFEKRCLDVIKRDTIQLLNSEDFLYCDLDFINMIVDEEQLNISEVDLFKAIENWAVVNMEIGDDTGNDKLLLTEVINKIRFFSMTLNEFIDSPNKSSLLTLEERHSLISNLAVRGSSPLPSRFCTKNYSRRKIVPGSTDKITGKGDKIGEAVSNQSPACVSDGGGNSIDSANPMPILTPRANYEQTPASAREKLSLIQSAPRCVISRRLENPGGGTSNPSNVQRTPANSIFVNPLLNGSLRPLQPQSNRVNLQGYNTLNYNSSIVRRVNPVPIIDPLTGRNILNHNGRIYLKSIRKEK